MRGGGSDGAACFCIEYNGEIIILLALILLPAMAVAAEVHPKLWFRIGVLGQRGGDGGPPPSMGATAGLGACLLGLMVGGLIMRPPTRAAREGPSSCPCRLEARYISSFTRKETNFYNKLNLHLQLIGYWTRTLKLIRTEKKQDRLGLASSELPNFGLKAVQPSLAVKAVECHSQCATNK